MRLMRSSARSQPSHGPDAAAGFVADVGELDALAGLVDDVVARLGGLDVLINNAGVALPGSAFQPLDEFDAHWHRTMDVNLTAHARLIHLARPHLAGAGEGRVVNIASTEALVTTAGMAAYAASKAGVVGLTKSFAVELGRHGITVNCICPGPIRTGMTAGISDADKDTYARRRVPLRRYGEPEEVAQMTLSLCLPAAELPQRGDHPRRRWHVDPPHVAVSESSGTGGFAAPQGRTKPSDALKTSDGVGSLFSGS